MKGVFITFEGIEGCGKSTQSNLLFQFLKNSNIDVILTREPGGTELGINIRKLLLNSSSVFPIAELFLFLADRSQHANELIKPALEKGAILICDRYYHSTYAYQAAGRNVGLKDIKMANELAINGIRPDITFLIDVPVEIGFRRKTTGNLELDRIEKENLEFHNMIRESYLKMKETEDMIYIIDGTKSKEIIKEEIIFVLKNNLLRKYLK